MEGRRRMASCWPEPLDLFGRSRTVELDLDDVLLFSYSWIDRGRES